MSSNWTKSPRVSSSARLEDDVRVNLFVVLKAGVTLDEDLEKLIRSTIRSKCTPRHVPAKLSRSVKYWRTKSGKIVELAVREVVHNRPVKIFIHWQIPKH